MSVTPYVAGVAHGIEVWEREMREARQLRFDPRGILATDMLATLKERPITRPWEQCRPLDADQSLALLRLLARMGWVECVETVVGDRGRSYRCWRLVEGAELPDPPDFTGAPVREDLKDWAPKDMNPPTKRGVGEHALHVLRIHRPEGRRGSIK